MTTLRAFAQQHSCFDSMSSTLRECPTDPAACQWLTGERTSRKWVESAAHAFFIAVTRLADMDERLAELEAAVDALPDAESRG
jgi:hypothetical protein